MSLRVLRRSRTRSTVILALICGLVGCRDELRANSRLLDGRRLSDLAVGASYTAVLYYSPDDCFACASSINDWRAIAATGVVRVALVLDRPAGDGERRSINAQRLKVEGIYDRPWFVRAPVAPKEILLDSTGRDVTEPGRDSASSALQVATSIVQAAGYPDVAGRILPIARDSASSGPKVPDR